MDDLHMCGSHREAWRRRCDGVGDALLVTLSVIYLEFKAHKDHITSTLPDTLDLLKCAYFPNRSMDDAIVIALHTALSHLDKSNHILLVSCTGYNYSEMLTF